MSITLISTWGLSTSNSYTSLTEANSLISMYVFNSEAWDKADDTFKLKCILNASQEIDSQNWHGGRYYWNQNMQFPRTPPGESNDLGFGGSSEGSDGSAIYYSLLEFNEYSRKQVERVKRATAVQAAYIAENQSGKNKGDPHKDLQKKGITNWSRSTSGVSESFSYGNVNSTVCAEAWDLLKYYKAPLVVVRGNARDWTNE